RGVGARGALARYRQQRRGLALAQVVAHGLAGRLGVAERAEQVVAQLERLTERQAVRGERRLELVEPTGQRRTEVEWTFDGVLAGLVRRDAARGREIGVAARGAQEIEVLADVELDPQLVPDAPSGGRELGEEGIGVHEREIADQD